MKRTVSIGLRVVLALAGVLYIVLALTWTDQLIAPAGMTLPDGRMVEESIRLTIVEREGALSEDGDFLVEADDREPDRQTARQTDQLPDTTLMRIPASAVSDTDQPGYYRYIPGIFTTLGSADFRLLALGLLIVAVIYPLQMVRWWMLMVCRGMDVTLLKALKLNMIGAFFNFCMPGTTGGDVVKAYYAAKGADRRADAVMSVIFDRIAGLVGLILLTAIAGLAMVIAIKLNWLDLREHEMVLIRQVTLYIWLGIAAITCGAAVYFSKRLRQLFRVDAILARLPGGGLLAKVDAAAVAYRDHRLALLGAVALSLPVHFALVVAAALAGYALGIDAPFGMLLAVLPVVFMAGAVPLTPLGLGVMEGLGHTLLVDPPAVTYNHIAGMLLMWRLYQIAYASLGSLLLLKGDIHLHPQMEELLESPISKVQGPESEAD